MPCGCLRFQQPESQSTLSDDVDDALYDVEEYNQLISGKSFSPVKVNGVPKTICINEKSVPVFYLLGGQKTCSSSVAASLARAGVVWHGPKELKMFAQADTGNFYSFPSNLPRHEFLNGSNLQLREHISKWTDGTYFQGRGLKGKQFPSCGSSELGAIADMTPTYMSAPDIATVLRKFYAESANDLTFMIVLREPFKRLYSAYHYLRRPKLAGYYAAKHGKEYNEVNFCRFIKVSYDKYYEPEAYADAIENSLYGNGLKRFIDANYSASQFVIVPKRAYSTNVSNVVAAAAEKLGTSLEFSREMKPFHANVYGSQRPPFDASIANCNRLGHSEQVDGIRKIFEADFKKLVEVLCAGHSKGMKLVGFSGPAGDCDAIGTYVKKLW